MDIKTLGSAVAQIAEERGMSVEKVVEIIETAIAAAFKKEYKQKGQVIKCEFDIKTGGFRFWKVLEVVDQSMIYSEKELEKIKEKKEIESEKEEDGFKKIRFNPERHILLEEAKKINPNIKVNEEIEIPLEVHPDFGRIAAKSAKQVILQKIKETEREMILEEFKTKEGEIISGIIQRIEERDVYFDLGKVVGILKKEEQIPGEFYKPGSRFKLYVLKVESTNRGFNIFLSRAYPKLVSKLFELEVPEISAGTVIIKDIAREPGSRTKIALTSTVKEIDPVGSAVGQRGTRVQVIINELGGEKIDIIEWSEEPEKYIVNALSPAKVLEIKCFSQNKALVVVPEDQLSLAIGKDGQNVRLAAKLTGWKIDVRPFEKLDQESKQESKKELESELESELKPKSESESKSNLESNPEFKSELKEESN